MVSGELVALGDYNGVAIQGRPSDQYINATAMCKATGKQYNDYSRLGQTEEFLVALSQQTGIPVCDLVISIKGTGTWVHRRVAIHLAQWCSADFAVWVSGRIEEIFLTGRSLVPREHSEAKLDQALGDIGRALVGITALCEQNNISINDVKQTVCEHGQAIDDLRQGQGRLELICGGQRKPFSKWVHKAFAWCISTEFLGNCLICRKTRIVTERNKPNDQWELHHWQGKGGNNPTIAFPCCSDCHKELERHPYKHAQYTFEFQEVQRRVEPVLDSMRPIRKKRGDQDDGGFLWEDAA